MLAPVLGEAKAGMLEEDARSVAIGLLNPQLTATKSGWRPRSASAAGAVRNVRCSRSCPVCHRRLGPPGSQRDNPATARLFLVFEVAMDRLEVVTELLRVSFASLPHF